MKVQKLRGPPDPVDVQAAQADLAKAKADLAALQQPPVPATPEAIDAANQAIDATNGAIVAARTKLRRLTKPNPADVESARLDLAKARADLKTLDARPGAPRRGPQGSGGIAGAARAAARAAASLGHRRRKGRSRQSRGRARRTAGAQVAGLPVRHPARTAQSQRRRPADRGRPSG